MSAATENWPQLCQTIPGQHLISRYSQLSQTVLSQFNNLITMDNLISSKHEKSASHLSIITTQSWFSQMILIDLTTHLKVLSTQSIDQDLTSHLKVIKLFQQDWDKYLSHLSIIFCQLIFYHQWCIFMLINHSTFICMPARAYSNNMNCC